MAMLNFKGKGIVQNHHLAVPFHELVPDKKKGLSDKPRLDDNLIVHGDNLLALKALLPTYAGKVKCIYIDPPYNTGNEGWAYNDNVSNPMMKEWLGKTVDTEDLTRHDKWLCMMMPRLKLLRELLTDDGSIFVSMDDNEQHHLRMLMDEIFGEANFITNVIWQKKYSPQNDAKYFSDMHDFVLVYAKNKETWRPNSLARTESQDAAYKNPDNDPRGPWKATDATSNKSKQQRPNLYYPVISPTGKKVWPQEIRVWRYSKNVFEAAQAENRVWWGKDGKNEVPAFKSFLTDVNQGRVPTTIWFYQDVGHNQSAKQELNAIFENNAFETPKPSTLIKRILELATDKDSVVLDSFAGSGTTAHAVLALNKEDGGNRKFVLVETEDYANTITAERVRRVIKGVKGTKDENLKKGFGGAFSYFELGKAIDEQGLLSGKSLPTYAEMARYVFHVATGEAFDAKKLDKKRGFVGESKEFEVYLIYEPNVAKLKELALTLPFAVSLGKPKSKRRLVFAPTKYLSSEDMTEHRIEFAQLPFEIYRRIS